MLTTRSEVRALPGEEDHTGSRGLCCLFLYIFLMLSGLLGQAPDDVKRRPENGSHRLVLQFRADQHEADQAGPLRLAFILEQRMGIAGDLQQPDALLDVVLVGLLWC